MYSRLPFLPLLTTLTSGPNLTYDQMEVKVFYHDGEKQ